jgi:hypothetical protein
MFALARHLGEHATELASLVGLGVAHLGLDTLEEMVQQPGCPNLHWALTDLPCPLVDLRKGVQGDKTLVARELARLRDDAPMTETEIEKFVSHFSGRINFAREQAGQPLRSLRTGLQTRVKDPDRIRAAGRRLIEAGCPEDLLKKFPAAQIVLLDEKRTYEILRDERLKLLGLPLWQIHPQARGHERAEDRDGLFADLLPQVVRLRQTQGRLQQQIAVLRHVEALRLYAAEHGGRLPKMVSDIPVPLPVDPFTGEPFICYTVDEATAHIRSHRPLGERDDTGWNVHYQVMLQK